MNEGHWPFAPGAASQPQLIRKGKGSNVQLESCSSDSDQREYALITQISIGCAMSGLRHMPTEFFLLVEMVGKTTRLSNKPVPVGKDVTEWETEILLPSERSSSVSFKMYASLEHGTRRGNGALLCRFKTTVGDLLDNNEDCELQPVRFLVKEGSSSSPSLRVTTERRICNVNTSATGSSLPESDTINRLAQFTDTGLHALLRYRRLHDQKDLDGAITRFERVRDMCPPNHPDHSAIVFNLATAKFIHCQDNKHYHDLDVSIRLYQEALQPRSGHHTDCCVTALDLCFSLLAYLRRQGNKADKTTAMDSLPGTVESYAYRVAWLALQMAGISVPVRSMQFGISGRDGAGRGEELTPKTRAILPDSNWDPALPTAFASSLLCLSEDDGDLGNINKAIFMLENAVQLIPDGRPFKPAMLNNLGSSFARRFERLGDLADINKSVSAFEQALRLTPRNHPERPDRLSNFGISLLRRFELLGDFADINESVSTQAEALRLTPNGHPGKPAWLDNLGNSLHYRFEYSGNPTDINTSISMQEEAVRLTPNGHPAKSARLNNLGSSLNSRFEHLNDLADINQSILMLEDAMRLTPDARPTKPTQLYTLGVSYLCRFERLGNLTDINTSISVLEKAVRLTPDGHPDKPARSVLLGSSLSARFERLGDLTDINRSILMQEEAVRLVPHGHIHRPSWLRNLGNSLLSRFERLGDVADMDESIVMFEEALRLTPSSHPDIPTMLNILGNALLGRFQRLDDLADLNRSISLKEEAMGLTPDSHPAKAARLSSLGNALLGRFQRLDDLADLNRSISLKEEAMGLTPDSHPAKAAQLSSLGSSLSDRFERHGDLADLDKSILMFEEALDLTPDGYPSKPTRLNNLGNSLSRRFEYLGDLRDITKSIPLLEEAVHLTPNDHPDKPAWLSHLGSLLLSRFNRLRDLADINGSISLQEEAVRLTPEGHADKPTLLNNLGTSLSSRYQRFENLVDLNVCISAQEEALGLTPDGHPGKPARLNNLGNSLFLRFHRLGHLTDLSRSIRMFEEALRLTPNGHPDKPAWLTHLGNSLMRHFRHSRDPSSLSAAILHFSLASLAPTGPAYIRFTAARNWISSALLEGNSQTLLDAYTAAIDLLPELAWVGLPLAERHRVLPEAADVARDAAAVAIEVGCTEMAVGWLEQGRSVVWSQFLQLRTPVDELRVEHPALANRFQQISRELENASSRENTSSRVPLEREVQKHHDLALTRERLLVEIRSLPGFERFLLPNTVKQLAASIHSGPAVYLNASKGRCDALIVMAGSGDVTPVPFPDISYLQMGRLQSLLYLMLKHNNLIISHDDISELIPPDVNPASKELLDLLLIGDGVEAISRAVRVKPQRIAGYSSDDLLQQILAFLWKKIVKPVLDALGFSTPLSRSQKMTRIFWCPTGPFAFLPIHAAGLYGTAEVGVKLSDFAISSYIPTLGALAPSPQKESNGCSSKIHLVVVPQPPTDGQNGLASVKEEIAHIKTLSAGSPFVTLSDSDGTIEDVMEKMKNADWVHFACHGVQDPDNPLDSGLCLADSRRLKLSDIIRLSRPQGGLAFLSACQTAQGDEKLAEESVHLAAGMLLAGYGGVIATMWAISDPDAPKVAKGVYQHLFRDGKKIPDCTGAAEALHYAIQRLRDSGASFCSWVPFIHVGR